MHGGDGGRAGNEGTRGVLAALAHSSFALVWGGALVSNVGNWIEITCQHWLVFKGSDSPEFSGLLQSVVTLPGVFLAVPMGLVADRVDRRRLFLWLQVALTLVAAVQALAAHLGYIAPWTVIAIAFAESIAAAATVPVWSSLLPDLVPRADMGGAIALSSFQFNVARMVGPWIAGFLVAHYGYSVPFDANVLSFGLVILALALVRSKERELPPRRPWRQEFGEAFRLSREHKGLRRLITTGALFLTLAAPQIPLLPALAKRQLGGDVDTFAHLISAMGIGAGVGALLMGVIGRLMSRRTILGVGSVMIGGTLLAASLATTPFAALATLFLFGLAWCVTLTAQGTAIQLIVPDQLRGRIMSLNYLCMMIPSTLAHLLAGVCAERSLRGTLTALAIGLFALGAWNLLFPEPEVDGRPIGEEKSLPAPSGPLRLPMLATRTTSEPGAVVVVREAAPVEPAPPEPAEV